ncbi:MAG: DNA-processing protein DprA [Bacteroidia bacterium]
MLQNERLYQIALTSIEGVGDVLAKNLLAYCGSAKAVFDAKKASLLKIPGIGERLAAEIAGNTEALKAAEKELRFVEEYKIDVLFFTDAGYPQRLKFCNDSPVLLYYKGSADLNAEKIVAVVGTRQPSPYGKENTEKFIAELKGSGILVVSGLAYGVDVLAHKRALEGGLDTVGVVAHGLDRIYPQAHESIARRMVKQGGLLTDFKSGTNPDAVNFPKRNRIVAGICDALVVVESKREGGSLITATIANSYNKDVFAFPGRTSDPFSEGCNGFIKSNRAALIESAADLFYVMNWNQDKSESKSSTAQIPLPLSLSAEEQKIIEAFAHKKQLHMDEISYASNFPVSKVAALLLQLEFSNVIKSSPGKMYSIVG